MFSHFSDLPDDPSHQRLLDAFARDGRGLWKAVSDAVSDRNTAAVDALWGGLLRELGGPGFRLPLWKHLDLLRDDQLDDGVVPYAAGTMALTLAACATIANTFDPTDRNSAGQLSVLDDIVGKLEGAFGLEKSGRPAGRQTDGWPDFIRKRLLLANWPKTACRAASSPASAPMDFIETVSGAWAWDALCALWVARLDVTRQRPGTGQPTWRPPLDVVHTCRVPVAGIDDGRTGVVLTLVLEKLDVLNKAEAPLAPYSGEAPLFHDPRYAFRASADEALRLSMERAWTRAVQECRARADLGACVEGRWKLLKGWHPLTENGAESGAAAAPGVHAADHSAGGAALRGWRFALAGAVPHDGVVVLACVDVDNGFGGLGAGIAQKVEAILHADDFDTIVVASENDADIAVRTLGARAADSRRPEKPGVQVLLACPDGSYVFVNPGSGTIATAPHSNAGG